ncbi:30S ribosomal protein S20 [Candidatus Nitronereus thalassa]|uniref:Small ribosomal subunit protein bS20 n=1 Tax=Candidatus Nitronereus thalassa TaxID=3020898 RepID=A0ABU3KA63_9BACT|nr:30S ribosomal protein S20 [Candidatus Nitronereus thalassa]MDT7043316.1 30S ribosomal protein S20 [Candidatus Nitronereus thalassa]
MPVVHTSAIKRARQSIKRHQRNKAILHGAKTVAKKVKVAVAENNPELAQTLLREATSTIAKAVTKGSLHRKTASRKISRLAKSVNSAAPKS